MDEELVKRAADGDDSAFEELVRRYEKRVYNMTLRMTGNAEDALDISQEAFIRVWRSLGKFKGNAKFSTWLFRIVSNLCTDHLRRLSRRREMPLAVSADDEERETEIADGSFAPDAAFEREELRRELDRAIDTLAPEHREIFLMREVYSLSYAEISETLGIEEGTVKSRLHRAREHLRELLIKSGNIPESFASNNRKGRGERR